MTQLTYFEVTGTWEPASATGIIYGAVSFTMLIEDNGVLAVPTLSPPAIVVPTVVHAAIEDNTLNTVSLLANTAALNLTGTLYYRADFSNVYYAEPGQHPNAISLESVTFAASTDTTPVNLVTVTPTAGVLAGQIQSVTTANISDATTLGRELLTAPSVAAALSDLAVINNGDGTLSVNNGNVLEPLSVVTIATTSATPSIGQTTYYNATSGNLTPTLPALSGLRMGSRLAVRRDPADTSTNTVTLSCAGSDTFYSSGGTSTTLPMSGEQREYQVLVVSGTKYWAPAGSLNPVSSLDKRYLHQWPFPMARNTIAFIGDSLTARGSQGNDLNRAAPLQGWLWSMYAQMLPVMTNQRMRWCPGNFSISDSWMGVGGNGSAQTLQLLDVLAMNPLPGACVLAVNGAEMLQNPAYSYTTNVGVLKSMVASLLAVGVVPILFTVPSLNVSGFAFGIPQATVTASVSQWNAFIRRYAAANGFPMIDAFTALTQFDGSRIPGTFASDGVHPNPVGNQLIVQQALADGLADIFPPNSVANTIRTTDNLTNLFNNGTINLGLFTLDSNSDGLADGLTTVGTPVCSIVAPAPTDQLAGNWQQVTVTGTSATGRAIATLTGWNVGDTIAFSCRVQTSGMVASNAEFLLAVQESNPNGSGFTFSDGSAPAHSIYNGLCNWQGGDITDVETVYVEFVVQPGCTALVFYGNIVTVPSGSATLRFGELTIRNLTTGGLLV